MPAPGSDLFTGSKWSVYDLILRHNYMAHREIYLDVAAQLRQFLAHHYALLDLGCGDAQHMARAMIGHPPATYHGVDLSQTALDAARHNLGAVDTRATFEQADLLSAITAAPRDTYDVVFAGFSVHHLQPEAKARFFGETARALRSGGCLLLVDVMRHEGESHDDYMTAYLGNVRQHWTELSAEQVEEVCTHVFYQDFPETVSALTDMAHAAEFAPGQLLNQFGYHRTLRFARP